MVTSLSILCPFKRGHFNFAQRGLYYFALTKEKCQYANEAKFAILKNIHPYLKRRYGGFMGMPSRLHGKMGSLSPSKVGTCKYCLRQYQVLYLVIEKNLIKKNCPFCEKTLFRKTFKLKKSGLNKPKPKKPIQKKSTPKQYKLKKK
jgi:hypothetical protein